MGVILRSLLEGAIAGDAKGPDGLTPPTHICSAGTELMHGIPGLGRSRAAGLTAAPP